MYGASFDFCDDTDKFGMKSFEMAEGEMCSMALKFAMKKAAIDEGALEVVFAGDLQNQCVASSGGLNSFGIPFIGVYGACSTCTESIMTLSAFMCNNENLTFGAAVTTSHNSAAERQFRTPIEYGGQRSKTAQWTSTAAGAFILKQGEGDVEICEYMPGRIIDGATSDGSNMGGAMAFAAADTIINYFKESGESASDIDYIVTGDLGKVGSDILRELIFRELPGVERLHTDCGLLLCTISTAWAAM